MNEEVKSFQIIPNVDNQYGGNMSLNSFIRMLKIFKSLDTIHAFDDNFYLLKQDGTVNENANLPELLELTQTKQERLEGIDDFISQLIKANIDLNLIINNNIKERLRAARENIPPPHEPPNNNSPPQTPPPPPGEGGEFNEQNNENNQSDNNQSDSPRAEDQPLPSSDTEIENDEIIDEKNELDDFNENNHGMKRKNEAEHKKRNKKCLKWVIASSDEELTDTEIQKVDEANLPKDKKRKSRRLEVEPRYNLRKFQKGGKKHLNSWDVLNND
jgi:hypothetical protein